MMGSVTLTNIRDAVICTLPLLLLVILSIRPDYAILAYTLDDPYIHLELAKNIFNGNYGINEHEFSSPSSSIFWPLILSPLSIFQGYIYAPLILNGIFLGLTLALILNHLLKEISASFIRIPIAFLFAFSFNLYGLPLTGMEHSLQVLCSAVIAIGLFDPEFRHKHLKIFYFALVLAPLVRYGSLALSVPIILYLSTLSSDRRFAILSGIALVILVGAFSLFLFTQSGYFFPSSVMIKQSAMSGSGVTGTAYKVLYNMYNLGAKYGWLIAIFVFTLLVTRTNKKLLITCFTIIFLYLALGRYGWFGRYEVFFVLFVAVAIFLIAKENFNQPVRILIFGIFLLPLAFGSLVIPTLLTPLASSNIYNQQYLISQFVRELDEPVAVNDLGLISLYSDKTVVDLWGLGSIQAMEARKANDRHYVDKLMAENDTNFAIIYREWFDKEALEKLIVVGELTLNERRITPAKPTVTFLAKSKASSVLLREKLGAFDFEDNILILIDDTNGIASQN